MELEILYLCEKEYPTLSSSFTQSVMHSHDHPELSLIFSGVAHYFIGNRTYSLKAGEAILLTPGTNHSVIIPKPNNYRDFHLGLSHLDGHLKESTSASTDGFLIINFKLFIRYRELFSENSCFVVLLRVAAWSG